MFSVSAFVNFDMFYCHRKCSCGIFSVYIFFLLNTSFFTKGQKTQLSLLLGHIPEIIILLSIDLQRAYMLNLRYGFFYETS